MRYKNARISSVRRVDARLLYIHCPQGKTRKAVLRQPFDVAAPRHVWGGADVLGPLVPLYGQLARTMGLDTLAPPFLVPDVRLQRGRGLAPESQWLAKAMPYSKFERLFQGLLVRAGRVHFVLGSERVLLWRGGAPVRQRRGCVDREPPGDPAGIGFDPEVAAPNVRALREG